MVSDKGIGMVKERQDEIYVQFKQLTPSYQGIYKGLGLYVLKQFIDELDGEIYVESELHKGTCFTCLIPLKLSFDR
ncbi:ATP-binding protein [Legionella nautarum]|uniref:ATP-binding protein n=1 Tax=Legionella nautarum TaxID=45070 RepID=UPI003B75BC7B